MRIVNLLLIVTLTIPFSLMAATSPKVKVSEIIAEGNEDGSSFVVLFESPIGVDPSEGTCSGGYHYLNASTEKGKMMFSMLLAAKAQDQTVRVILSQGSSASRCAISGVRY